MNDLAFVERAVSLLASKGVDAWVFGGWGEELRGLIKPREHVDLDLLYPAEDWSIVDNLYLDWIEAKRFDWKRAFKLEDDRRRALPRPVRRARLVHAARSAAATTGRPTSSRANGRVPVASTAALAGYRHSYRVDAAT